MVDYVPRTWGSEEFTSAGVNRIENGVGALATGKVDRGELVINVKAPGNGLTACVGDGTVDDGPAINAIITWVCNNPLVIAATLYFPSVTASGYLIQEPIDLPYFTDKMRQITLRGDGRSGSKIIVGGASVIQAMIRHKQPLHSVTSTVDASAGAAHVINGLRLDCNNKAKFGILLINSHAVHIHNMMIRNACSSTVAGESTAGIKITGDDVSEFLSWENHVGPNVRIEGGGSGGVATDWATYGVWANSTDNHFDGVVALRHEVADIRNSSGNNFYTNCHTFYSDVGFYSRNNTAGSQFVNCEADGPLVDGWVIESDDTTMVGNTVFWPGSVPGGAHGIRITRSIARSTIVGNTIKDVAHADAIVITGAPGVGTVIAHNGGASLSTSIAGPYGTYLAMQYPDNATTGGAARGGGAADFQFSRTGASEVASGNDSFAAGARNTVSGTAAVGFGDLNFADASYTMVTGNRAHTRGAMGKRAHASGRFAVTGDQQISEMVVSVATASTTTTRLTAGANASSTGRIDFLLPTVVSSALFTVSLMGFCPSTGDTGAWRTDIIARKDTSLASLVVVGTPSWTTIGGSATGITATPSVIADTTLGGITVAITAPNATAWHWVARITGVEVG